MTGWLKINQPCSNMYGILCHICHTTTTVLHCQPSDTICRTIMKVTLLLTSVLFFRSNVCFSQYIEILMASWPSKNNRAECMWPFIVGSEGRNTWLFLSRKDWRNCEEIVPGPLWAGLKPFEPLHFYYSPLSWWTSPMQYTYSTYVYTWKVVQKMTRLLQLHATSSMLKSFPGCSRSLGRPLFLPPLAHSVWKINKLLN